MGRSIASSSEAVADLLLIGFALAFDGARGARRMLDIIEQDRAERAAVIDVQVVRR